MFYDCAGSESFQFADPWEAVEAYLDGFLEPTMDDAKVEDVIRAECPIVVTAYSPDKVSDADVVAWSKYLVDILAENWASEYGDPDGYRSDSLPKDANEIMLDAVTKIVQRMPVWRCSPVGKVELSGDRVVEWARKECPKWSEGLNE